MNHINPDHFVEKNDGRTYDVEVMQVYVDNAGRKVKKRALIMITPDELEPGEFKSYRAAFDAAAELQTVLEVMDL